jgi:hypothetical protein
MEISASMSELFNWEAAVKTRVLFTIAYLHKQTNKP